MRANKKLCLFVAVLVPMLLFCFHMWNKSEKVVSIWNREAPEDVPDDSVLQTHEKYAGISLKWKDEVLELLPKKNCKCEAEATLNIPFRRELMGKPYAVNFTEAVEPSEFGETHKRRELEFKNFKKRSYSPADRIIIAEANSPLQYPLQGVEVRPLKTILVPGLSLLDRTKKDTYKVSLASTLGTFDVAAEVDSVTINGAGGKQITVSSSALDNLNRQLQLITYTNTVFHPNTADPVQFQSDGHSATFIIKVRHPTVPKLYDMGPSKSKYNISALVTIATKTFLRYDKLQDLIDSIRKFYPTVTIIIADDSEKPQKVEGPFIDHYIMPFGKGWFAGRNLAISQVTTKYVLWADDDFIFSAQTKIEKLVEVLEKTSLDLVLQHEGPDKRPPAATVHPEDFSRVGGAVREISGYYATYRQTISIVPGDKEGDCLKTLQGYHHVIEGFPNCVVTDGVINFFLARTDKILKVGFDPRLARIGHLEFFVDGLGTLHVGSCDDVVIDHASKLRLPWSKTKSDEEYSKFRYPKTSAKNNFQHTLFYFKNRFKCMTGN